MPRSYVHAESNVARVPRLKLWAVHPYMMRPSLGQLREAQASVAKERAQVRRQLFSAVNVVCKVGLGALAAAQRPRRTTSVATMTTVQVSSQAEIESDGAVHGSPRPQQVRSSDTATRIADCSISSCGCRSTCRGMHSTKRVPWHSSSVGGSIRLTLHWFASEIGNWSRLALNCANAGYSSSDRHCDLLTATIPCRTPVTDSVTAPTHLGALPQV